MSDRQVRKMFQLMATGEAVELTSAMASVKKLARLAFIAEQFGYQYADVRQGGGRNSSLKMVVVPDPSPAAQQRAAQNWAQYPQAGSGGPLPPLVPDALELLKARLNFDLTGKSAEKRMALGAVGFTVGALIGLGRADDGIPFIIGTWVVLMAVLGVGIAVTRKRNAKFAARLRSAGFTPVTDETGRVRYLPPGGGLPGHSNPFAAGAYGVQGPGASGAPVPGPYGAPGTPGPYGAQAGTPAQYGAPAPGQYGGPAPGPYSAPAPGQYGGAPAPGPYGAPAPGPYAPQAPGPYAPQAPGPYSPPQAPGAHAPQVPGPYGESSAQGPYGAPAAYPQQPQPPQR
ncbi:hypothetical protein ABT009_00450 [Streptomyces sp. NPDC002896]|uniref:hypothetical protein n=1 Tax=Streptomyces sp. NPDC002896 TaxID=3154438 RepID=UPI003318C2FE